MSREPCRRGALPGRRQALSHGAKKTAQTVTTDLAAKAAPRGPVEDNPLYGIAMLKIAMELKKPDALGLEEIVEGVLAKMKLPEDEFRAFLAQNGGLLRTIAERKRY